MKKVMLSLLFFAGTMTASKEAPKPKTSAMTRNEESQDEDTMGTLYIIPCCVTFLTEREKRCVANCCIGTFFWAWSYAAYKILETHKNKAS